jgi:hypothetical protein
MLSGDFSNINLSFARMNGVAVAGVNLSGADMTLVQLVKRLLTIQILERQS